MHPAVECFPEGCRELSQAQHTPVPSSQCHSATAISLSPSAKTTGEERALLFLPPLLTQLGGLEPGEVPPPEGQEPPHTHFVAQAVLEEAKLLRPPHTGLLGAARASLSLCRDPERGGNGERRDPSSSWWVPLCLGAAGRTVPGMTVMCNPKAVAAGAMLCKPSPAKPPIAFPTRPHPSQGCSYNTRGFALGAVLTFLHERPTGLRLPLPCSIFPAQSDTARCRHKRVQWPSQRVPAGSAGSSASPVSLCF